MKLYCNRGFAKNNLKDYNKKIRQYTLLISDEGIFKVIGKNINKMIIKKDIVESIRQKDEELVLDKSEVDFIKHDKIPLNYSKQEYFEEVFTINDEINIVCTNDTIWYAEYFNDVHKHIALNIISNNV